MPPRETGRVSADSVTAPFDNGVSGDILYATRAWGIVQGEEH